jgi:hypothetical protein
MRINKNHRIAVLHAIISIQLLPSGGSLRLAATTIGAITPARATVVLATPLAGTASAVTGATVLNIGVFTLSAIFTPIDHATYSTATRTALLTVNAGTVTTVESRVPRQQDFSLWYHSRGRDLERTALG